MTTTEVFPCAVCDEPCHTGDRVIQAEHGDVMVVHQDCMATAA